MFNWLYKIPDEIWDKIETWSAVGGVLLLVVESIWAWIVTRGS